MNKKKIITIVIFVLIVILAILFMVLGAKEEGRKYSLEEIKNYNYFLLQENEKYGVIDKQANIIIEPKFENIVIPNPSKALFICTTENKQTIILNEKNEEQFKEYAEVSCIKLKNIATDLMYEKSVLRYKENNKYGLIDYKGSKITDPIYGQIEGLEYKEGELLVEKDGKFGVINIKGINLVPIEYETIKVDQYYNETDKYAKDGYIVGVKTEEGYRYGYIDIEGKEILKPEYNELSRIIDVNDESNIYFLASKNGQYGVYKNQNQIINNEYQSIDYNKSNKIFILEKSKRYGVADVNGNTILELKYAQIDISGKYIYAKDKNGTTEVYDSNGKITNMSSNISKLSVENEQYTIVISSEDNKTTYGVEDKKGKQLIENKYNYIEYLFDNYFIVSNDEGNLGIIDENGKEILETKYNSIQKIKDTKMIQTSILSESLTEIYSEKIEKIAQMNNAIIKKEDEYIKAYNEDETIYINLNGKIANNKELFKNNTLFSIKKDGKWGFEDKDGNIKVDCKYDRVTELNEYGYAGIQLNGKWGVIDNSGKIVLEPTYEFKTKSDPDFLGKYYKVTFGLGEVIYTNK